VVVARDSLATIESAEYHRIYGDRQIINLTVTSEDGPKSYYYITVNRQRATGIVNPVPERRVYCENGIVHIDTPITERIKVYSVGGCYIRLINRQAKHHSLSTAAKY
jgi:hypothetical protein